MVELTVQVGGKTQTLAAQAVSIDFYDTLVTIDRPRPSIAEQLTQLGFRCSEDDVKAFDAESFNGKFTPSGTAYDEWRLHRLRNLCRYVGVPPQSASELASRLISVDKQWTVKAADGALRFVSGLTMSQTPFVIITNWDYDLRPYLAQAGLDTGLNVLTSRAAGVRKPHPAIFEKAASMYKLPDDVVHVGDRFDSDVKGARAAGWTPCWLTEEAAFDGLATARGLPTLMTSW